MDLSILHVWSIRCIFKNFSQCMRDVASGNDVSQLLQSNSRTHLDNEDLTAVCFCLASFKTMPGSRGSGSYSSDSRSVSSS